MQREERMKVTEIFFPPRHTFNPVVFCRYIATAHYLGKHLAGKLKDVTIDVVTGELTSDERKEKVDPCARPAVTGKVT
jgi:hypothetical protein